MQTLGYRLSCLETEEESGPDRMEPSVFWGEMAVGGASHKQLHLLCNQGALRGDGWVLSPHSLTISPGIIGCEASTLVSCLGDAWREGQS